MKKYSIWLGLFILSVVLVFSITDIKIKAAGNQVKPIEKYLAPNFTLPDINNQKVNLKNVLTKNKLTLVNFWATWCPPCRAEIPELITFYKKYSKKGITILAINLQEDPGQVKMFAKSNRMNFPILTDLSGEVASKYQVFAIPTTFAVDKNGRIQWIIKGSTDLKTLETKALNILKGK